jgi:hypothetical protein
VLQGVIFHEVDEGDIEIIATNNRVFKVTFIENFYADPSFLNTFFWLNETFRAEHNLQRSWAQRISAHSRSI